MAATASTTTTSPQTRLSSTSFPPRATLQFRRSRQSQRLECTVASGRYLEQPRTVVALVYLPHMTAWTLDRFATRPAAWLGFATGIRARWLTRPRPGERCRAGSGRPIGRRIHLSPPLRPNRRHLSTAVARTDIAAGLILTTSRPRRWRLGAAAQRRDEGFTPKDMTWILTHAPVETLVLRPTPEAPRRPGRSASLQARFPARRLEQLNRVS